jgi:hypothetical protein
MEVRLTQDMFVNNKYHVAYGNREAMFTIVDEIFAGNNNIGRINKITTLVRKFSVNRNEEDAWLSPSIIIGLGNGIIGAMSDNPELRGKVMNKDNMEQCVVILYEDK